MRKLTTLFVFIGLLAACKKSNQNGGSGSIQGTWKFLYLAATTRDNATSAGGYSSTTFTSYKTIDNGGTVTFTTDSMEVTGLTYTVNTTATSYIYIGNVLQDSLPLPFNLTLPATNESIAIKAVGNDSLYAPNGGIVPANYSGVTVSASQPSGVHYVISHDTLEMTEIGTGSASGATVSAVSDMFLVRQ